VWRPARGATSRPGCCRPANGFGRAVGRPGPRAGGPLGSELSEADGERAGTSADDAFGKLVGLIADRAEWVQEADAEAPAPVTP
jgi:hypothetical protein